MNNKIISHLEAVVNYLHTDERKNWEELNKPEEHIYNNVHALALWLDDEKNGEHI